MITDMLQPNKVRIPWLLRNKVEVSGLQLVGQNAIGLPYLQGQIRNCTDRSLNLRVTARVFNDQNQAIFSGKPGVLDMFVLEPNQQRTFRISLSDVSGLPRQDRQRLWITRAGLELSVEA